MAPEYRRNGQAGLSYQPYCVPLSLWPAVLNTLAGGKRLSYKGASSAVRRHPRAALGITMIVTATSCAPPDRPVRSVGPLPQPLLVLLEPDSVRTRFLGDGLAYHYLWSPKGPWAVHVLRVDLERCDLGLGVLPAGHDKPSDPGLATVSALVEYAGGEVLAAVNGDFFTAEGRPVGPEVADGRLLRSRARPALSWHPGSDPWIGTTEVGQGGLKAGFWVSSDQTSHAQVIGGFPELLDHGTDVTGLGLDPTQTFAAARHPRTAVGFDPVARRLWLLVVDGRQGAYSSGMTLAEVTAALSAVGSTEALNLDGGGSTVMVVAGTALSSPSDAEGERAVRNALAVVTDPGFCRSGQ